LSAQRGQTRRSPRRLTEDEITELLAADLRLRLATLDRGGYPHVTPLWFLWEVDAFYMTSLDHRAHVRRLREDPRVGLCIDAEGPERDDGERPNVQVRAVGTAEVFSDADGGWTRAITEKYVHGPGIERQLEARMSGERVVIRLRPGRLIGLASV
jgi:nitroimidazol reductase NimA-like FMN-containing flavoprotein (pyridoxamine 5'-phosphate oxidase superfamily)